MSFSIPLVAQSTDDLEKELDLDDLGSDDGDVAVPAKKKAATDKESAATEATENQKDSKAESKKNPARKSKTVSRDTTKVDFDAAAIEGERKLPQNMFLNGQIKQDFSQMIHLRRNFRNELRNSGAAVRALVK